MSALTLKGTPEELASARAKKVLAVASLAAIPITCHALTLQELSALSPLASGMILSYGEVCQVAQCNGMMRFIATLSPTCSLLGKSLQECAIVEGWLDFFWHSIELPLNVLAEKGETYQSLVQSKLETVCSLVANHLSERPYIVGNSLTLADVCLAVVLQSAVSTDVVPVHLTASLSVWFNRVKTELSNVGFEVEC